MGEIELKQPRFNHVGFTIPRDSLNAEGRRRIVSFYSDCFGFIERTEYTKDRQMLVLMAGAVDQFIVLFGADTPTTAGNAHDDHFGMACNSIDELKVYLERVRKHVAKDPTIVFEDYSVSNMKASEGGPAHNLHKFYIRVGTPFNFEVQYYEWLDQHVASDKGAAQPAAKR